MTDAKAALTPPRQAHTHARDSLTSSVVLTAPNQRSTDATLLRRTALNVPPVADESPSGSSDGLPRPIQRALWFLALSFQCETDDAHQRIRKVALGCAPFGALIFVIAAGVRVATFGGPTSVADVLSLLAFVVFFVGLMAGWGIVKRDKTRDRFAVDVMLFASCVTMSLRVISDIRFPVWCGAGVTFAVGISCDSTRKGLIGLWGLLLLLLSVYNTSRVESQDGDADGALMVDGATTDPSFSNRMQVLPNILGILAIMCLVAGLQRRELARFIAVRKADVGFISGLAAALSTHDVAAASTYLDAARRSGHVDDETIRAMETVVAGLTRSQPYLPNWVTEDTSADVPAVESDTESVASQRLSLTNVSEASSFGTFSRFGDAMDDATVAKTLAAGQPVVRRVVVAQVTFRMPSRAMLRVAVGVDDASDAMRVMTAATHGFVNRVFNLASTTSAALHGFAGDAVQLSWNAVRNHGRPEESAGKFLARLRSDAGHELVRCWGAAAWGDSRVQIAGTAQHKVLMVTPAFQTLWTTAQELARRHVTFVVDRNVYRGASRVVHFRGVDVIDVGRRRRAGHRPSSPRACESPASAGSGRGVRLVASRAAGGQLLEVVDGELLNPNRSVDAEASEGAELTAAANGRTLRLAPFFEVMRDDSVSEEQESITFVAARRSAVADRQVGAWRDSCAAVLHESAERHSEAWAAVEDALAQDAECGAAGTAFSNFAARLFADPPSSERADPA